VWGLVSVLYTPPPRLPINFEIRAVAKSYICKYLRALEIRACCLRPVVFASMDVKCDISVIRLVLTFRRNLLLMVYFYDDRRIEKMFGRRRPWPIRGTISEFA
jgi:hypothetical protein